jgi:molybdopterin-binding protein
MEISARNVLEGIVENVEVGAVMASVKIKISPTDIITAVITRESVEKMGIKKDDKVSAVVKSTEVMVAKD